MRTTGSEASGSRTVWIGVKDKLWTCGKLTLLVEGRTENTSSIKMVFFVVEGERRVELKRIEIGVVRVDIHVGMASQPPALCG